MSADDISNAFIQHYFTTLDTNPAILASLYQPHSSITIEGTKLNPAEAIQRYQALGLKHDIANLTKDIQPGQNSSCLIIFVTGKIIIGGQSNPLNFSQMFQLVATAPGQYYVHNEAFRLIY